MKKIEKEIGFSASPQPGDNLNKAVAACGFKLIQVSVSVYSHGSMLNFRHSCQKFHMAK